MRVPCWIKRMSNKSHKPLQLSKRILLFDEVREQADNAIVRATHAIWLKVNHQIWWSLCRDHQYIVPNPKSALVPSKIICSSLVNKTTMVHSWVKVCLNIVLLRWTIKMSSLVSTSRWKRLRPWKNLFPGWQYLVSQKWDRLSRREGFWDLVV